MNLVMASVLLLAMLAFQPTLIYGTRSTTVRAVSYNSDKRSRSSSDDNGGSRSGRGGKKYLAQTDVSSYKSAFQTGDVLLRGARDADTLPAGGSDSVLAGATASERIPNNSNNGNGNGNGKRNRNNNNKRANKNSTPDNATPTNGQRKHNDKKYSATLPNQQQQHGKNNNNNNNNRGKQRQVLKSQQHQNHGKRSGIKSRNENTEKTEKTEKTTDGDKTPSTCRYAKSAWSECDTKTNMRSRTLTLKKGESNCLSTRTMQKKCKKSCRYEKGSWTDCHDGKMTRQDKLKTTDDATCQPMREISKKCNPATGSGGSGGGGKHGGGKAERNKERKNKDKTSRRAQQQQQQQQQQQA